MDSKDAQKLERQLKSIADNIASLTRSIERSNKATREWVDFQKSQQAIPHTPTLADQDIELASWTHKRQGHTIALRFAQHEGKTREWLKPICRNLGCGYADF